MTDDEIEVGKPKTWAAGVPGVTHAMGPAFGQMGVIRTLKTLTHDEPEGRLRLPGLRLAGSRRTARRPSSARTAPRPSPRRPRRRPCRPSFFAEHSHQRAAEPRPSTGWAAGPARPSRWYCAAGDDPLRADLLGRRLRADRPASSAASTHPDEAVFYTSRPRPPTRPRSLYQLFVRAFGTNNLPDCSNMCHESTALAHGRDDRHRQGHGQPRGLRTRPT